MSPPRATKIVCVGRNFPAHARELGNPVPERPVLFLKPVSALIGPGQAIRLPPESGEVHHEAEAALIIGRRARRLPASDAALEVVAAWTTLIDVTARDLQRADGGRFTRAKGFDTFCPLSAERVPPGDWRGWTIRCRVNGATRQSGALADMLFGPAAVLADISRIMTLEPGDIVSLGTPPGVGPLAPGDRVESALLDSAGAVLAAVECPVAAS